jgi:hypothetical protein
MEDAVLLAFDMVIVRAPVAVGEFKISSSLPKTCTATENVLPIVIIHLAQVFLLLK